MRTFSLTKHLYASALFLLIGSTAHAVTLSVNCGSTTGLSSINAALKVLQSSEESHVTNTINVSGACHENLSISNADGLTLNAAPGASISDASGGTNFVILIDHSPRVDINGFTINGAVTCQLISNCRFSGNSFQGSYTNGVAIVGAATALFSGDTIRNAKGAGLLINADAAVGAGGITVTGSAFAGAGVHEHSLLDISNSTLQNNQAGIRMTDHSTLHSAENTITGNARAGVSLESGSEALFSVYKSGNVITGNGGYGVRVADLSFANFESPGNDISGNNTVFHIGEPNVACLPQFSATRGALTNIGTGGTNCVEP